MATGGKTWKLSNHFFSDREKRTLCCQQIVHERTQNTNIAIFSFTAASKELQKTFRGVVKKRIFYGQADRKGGSAPSALTVSKCENFGPIFPIIKW